MTDTLKMTAGPPAGNTALPPGLWPIRCAEAVADALDTCRKSGQMGLVTGPSGAGKTTAARAVVSAMQDRDEVAHYIMMTRAADGLQPGLLRIGRAIGAFVEPNMGGADIYDAVARVLGEWPPEAVLVLDEAQFMSEALMDAIHNLSDELRGRGRRCGIVMVGTPDLAARINGRSGRARHFEPLRGRLYVAEIDALCAEDFAKLAGALGLGGPGAAEAIAKASAARGGLHNVARVVDAARGLAGAGKPLALSHIRVAMQGLGVAS